VGLARDYQTTKAPKGIDLTAKNSKVFACLGVNGYGKNATIRILTGLPRITAGSAMLNGHDIARESLAAKKHCGRVPQQINLESELTVS
jgi:ABC-2 type transport system ATP-binding protein